MLYINNQPDNIKIISRIDDSWLESILSKALVMKDTKFYINRYKQNILNILNEIKLHYVYSTKYSRMRYLCLDVNYIDHLLKLGVYVAPLSYEVPEIGWIYLPENV